MMYKDRICENCAHHDYGECEIYGMDENREFNTCVNFAWDAAQECGLCPARKGNTLKGSTCDNHCHKFPINSGHPLSPCNGCEPEYTEEGETADDPMDAQLLFCEVDENAIARGNRCTVYTSWLFRMARGE